MSAADGPVDVRPRKAMRAWQITAENIREVASWCQGTYCDDDTIHVDRGDWTPQIAEIGDWVIQDEAQVIVLEPEWFARHYEITNHPNDEATEVRQFATTSGSYRFTRR